MLSRIKLENIDDEQSHAHVGETSKAKQFECVACDLDTSLRLKVSPHLSCQRQLWNSSYCIIIKDSETKEETMLNRVAIILFLTIAVRSDSSFVFPDQVSSRHNTGSGYGDSGRNKFNSYENRLFGSHNHYPEHSGYYGDNERFVPGFGNHHGYDNRPSHTRPEYGSIVSHSQANAQSTGSGSLANAQSGSEFFNQIGQSNAQSQAQSQGYQPEPCYNCGSNGGSGASSASSAASATSGIVNGIAVASAAAAASAAGAGNGGAGAVAASASSSSSSGNPGGFSNGFNSGFDQIPPWYFRNRIAGDDNDSVNNNDEPLSVTNEATIIFSVK